MIQAALRFDGATFSQSLDGARLGRQLLAVRDLLQDGKWWTLAELEQTLDYQYPNASISSRIRDLRKPRFGGHTIERRRASSLDIGYGYKSGTWFYRMVS